MAVRFYRAVGVNLPSVLVIICVLLLLVTCILLASGAEGAVRVCVSLGFYT